MKVIRNFIEEYVDLSLVDTKEFNEKMIMTGTMVEKVENISNVNTNIVIGKILNISKHPDADKLVVLNVDIGEKTQIVTGAKNIKENDYVVVAKVGAKLSNGLKIKKSKLRGVESNGMLLSYEELGFNKSVINKDFEDGVIILNKEYSLGSDFFKELKLDSDIIEFEITFNRPDCQSVFGLSKEVSATFDLDFKDENKEIEYIKSDIKIKKDINVCTSYIAVELNDINIKRSPDWLELRLMSMGLRPTNNLVDLTNYLMVLTGNPIHAFDSEKIKDEIVIDLSKEGEEVRLLDDKLVKLDNDIVIRSGEIVALAGVMGGANSTIETTTKNTVIEIANFNKNYIRNTSKRLNIKTEASKRFEKGIDNSRSIYALNKLVKLLKLFEIDYKEFKVSKSVEKDKEVLIDLRIERLNLVLGTDIKEEKAIDILAKLGIERIKDLTFKVPSFRLDLLKEIDLIEEVARIYGYNNIESVLDKIEIANKVDPYEEFKFNLRDILWSLGVSEMINYSFVSPKWVTNMGLSSDNAINLVNPLGEDYSQMRPSLIVNAIEVLKRNERLFRKNVRFFEIGNIFHNHNGYNQREMLVICGYQNLNYYSFKGIIENILEYFSVENFRYIPNESNEFFHKIKSASLIIEDEVIGHFGKISPFIKKEVDLINDAFFLEIDLIKLFEKIELELNYKAVSIFPSINLDISVLVNKDITHYEIEKVIRENGGKYLKDIKLFDVYIGEDFQKDLKSMSYSMLFNSDEKTLKDEDVLIYYNKVLKELETKFNAIRR